MLSHSFWLRLHIAGGRLQGQWGRHFFRSAPGFQVVDRLLHVLKTHGADQWPCNGQEAIEDGGTYHLFKAYVRANIPTIHMA